MTGLTPGEIALITCLFALPIAIWLGSLLWRRVFGEDPERMRERRVHASAYARETVAILIVTAVITAIVTWILY